MKGWRKITVGGINWKYRIGKQNVVARNGDVVKHINYGKLTGYTWDEIERAEHKRYFHITPKIIAEWLIAP